MVQLFLYNWHDADSAKNHSNDSENTGPDGYPGSYPRAGIGSRTCPAELLPPMSCLDSEFMSFVKLKPHLIPVHMINSNIGFVFVAEPSYREYASDAFIAPKVTDLYQCPDFG
jgi:hypothetical protein